MHPGDFYSILGGQDVRNLQSPNEHRIPIKAKGGKEPFPGNKSREFVIQPIDYLSEEK